MHGSHIGKTHPCPPCLTVEKTQRTWATTSSSGHPELTHQEVKPGSLPVAFAHLVLPTSGFLEQSWTQPSPSSSLSPSMSAARAPRLVEAGQNHHCETRSLGEQGKEVQG